MPAAKRPAPKVISIVLYVNTEHVEVSVTPTEAYVAPNQDVVWRLFVHRGDPKDFPHERREFTKSTGELVLHFESEVPFGHRILRGAKGTARATAQGASGPHHYRLVAAHQHRVAAIMHCPSIVIR